MSHVISIPLARLLDANANRVREALRTLEDVARFITRDGITAGELKQLRHDLAEALSGLSMQQGLLARDVAADPGTAIETPTEMGRTGLRDVAVAAGKRLSEALRVLEEAAKTVDAAPARQLEQLRYRAYALEQIVVRSLGGAAVMVEDGEQDRDHRTGQRAEHSPGDEAGAEGGEEASDGGRQ